MIAATRSERRWFLENIARGLVEYLGSTEPPVPVEDLLNHPPRVYHEDFGVMDMHSDIWDATFARSLGNRGSVFVSVDLPAAERRYALARETLSAILTSDHGRKLGLQELVLDDLRDSADYFARVLLIPESLRAAYLADGGSEQGFAVAFEVPSPAANVRWMDPAPNLN